MNKVILMGRLVRDPEVKYTGAKPSAVARYTLAVDRRIKKEGGDQADFIQCVAFGKSGEFAEKYFKKGTKIVVEGRIQTGSYEKDGQRIYTTDVVVEQQEFAESKASGTTANSNSNSNPGDVPPRARMEDFQGRQLRHLLPCQGGHHQGRGRQRPLRAHLHLRARVPGAGQCEPSGRPPGCRRQPPVRLPVRHDPRRPAEPEPVR